MQKSLWLQILYHLQLAVDIIDELKIIKLNLNMQNNS